jgi:hypothetical protein
VTTVVAVNTEEAVRDQPAAEVGAKLLLDEARGGLLPAPSGRQEAFELLAYDPVKKSLLRLMAFVLGHEVPVRDRVGESAEEKTKSRSVSMALG